MTTPRRRKNFQLESEDIFGISNSRVSKQKKQKLNDDDILNDASVFGELIKKAGFILKKGDQPNLLKCDQAVFQKDLRKFLKIHPQYKPDTIVNKFMEALEKHVENIVKLKWALLYTQTSSECTNARGGQQDSLIRLLLNIDELQTKLVTLLTEKLLEVAYDDDAGNNQQDIPRLILANLRWLDHIADPETLACKVSDLLHGSPQELQIDVISFVPNIVDDQYHPQIAKELIALYDSTPELTSSILDSLPHLTLPSETVNDIHHSVLKTLQGVRPHNLPVVIKFLLHNTSQNLASQVLSDIRDKIQLPGDSISIGAGKASQLAASRRKNSSEKENSDYEIILFSHIKMSVLTHKFLSTSWLKVINEVPDPKDIGAFDLLILILFHEVVPNRRKAIESIIRNKIRGGLPVDVLLKTTFSNHTHVLKEYFESLKKIAATLLRSAEPTFCNYGAAIYKFSFTTLDEYQRQEVILSLLAHLGDNESVRMGSLCLLSQLAHEETNKMVKYTAFLKGAMDLMDLLSLREAKKLMDAIILLAHSETDQSGFRDELNILVRKQLSHTDLKYKRLGVLSAVLTLKNTMGIQVENNENIDSFESESALTEAETLFQIVKSSTVNSPFSCALFMDELASSILRNGFSLKLEQWINNRISCDFEETFIIDCSNVGSNEDCLLPVAVQFILDVDDTADSEPSDPVSLNLAQKVFEDFEKQKEGGCQKSDIITLAPHFRLLRMVQSHLNNGDLSEIDAVLGCGILMPKPTVYEKFASLSDEEKSVALTCLFYLINWFREVVNAFVTLKEADIKRKVIERLNQIIALQDQLSTLLPLHPNFAPPPAVFDFDLNPVAICTESSAAMTTAKKAKKAPEKKGKKRKKGEEPDATLAGLSQTQMATQQTQCGQKGERSAKEGADLRNYRPYFREFGIDVFHLFFRELCLDSESENSRYLSLAQIEFLLIDLNAKLSRVFEAGTKRLIVLGKSSAERDVGFSHIDLFTAAEVVERASLYIKPICVHLEKISAFFQSLIDDNDGIEDAPCMYSEKTEPITKVYTMLFTTIKIFLSWPGFQLPDHSEILQFLIKQIAKKIEGSSVTQMNRQELIISSFRYISNFSDSVVCCSTAVELVQVLDAIITLSNEDGQLKSRLAEVIEKFLKKEWFTEGGNKDKGSTFNRNILLLLQTLFHHTKDTIGAIHLIASEGIKSLIEAGGKDPTSEVYPTMTKTTLLVYYRCLLENLVTGTRKSLSSVSGTRSNAKKLEIWNVAIKAFHILVETVKTFDSGLMLALCLKYSKGFLELFLRQGMPLMDKCFLSDQQEVMALIRNLQLSTRFLQHMCTHSKLKRDTRLMQYVPLVKRSLEGLVFRVKAMLAVNQCSGAFWLGDLKNKDLHGKELPTQAEPESEDEEEEGEAEEAVALEDDQSDVELDEENSNEDVTSKKGDDENDPSEDDTNEYSASF